MYQIYDSYNRGCFLVAIAATAERVGSVLSDPNVDVTLRLEPVAKSSDGLMEGK